MSELQVQKDRLTNVRLLETGGERCDGEASEGEICVRIERFAFTANNITYGAVGHKIGYWQFFPPHGEDAEGWGVIPVWGFAEVVASGCADIPVGERLFGYFPPAKFLKMTPVRVTEHRFVDGAEHRAKLPAAYNNYTRVNAEPGYDRASDDLRMLLWPLHITSFCLWDALQDNDWYGAQQVVIVSASSKTSIGLAYALSDDESAPRVIGVTSDRNLDFTSSLGLYDATTTYDLLTDIDATVPTVIVDMSGNREVLGRLHTHLGDNMKFCSNVGLTHWDEQKGGSGFIAERSEIFFAPSHIQKRMQEWGPDGFTQKSSSFLAKTAGKCSDWLEINTIDGLQGLADIYVDVCEGRIAANQGLVVKL